MQSPGALRHFWDACVHDSRELATYRPVISRINDTLVSRKDIKVSKVRDISDSGLHWYVMVLQDAGLNERIRGAGFGYSDESAIVRAWGEFVERYSFCVEIQKDLSILTSNGFAAHTNEDSAKENAVTELIERDVFLSSWLLHRPAKEVDISLAVSPRELDRLKRLTQRGFKIRFGVYGTCMGRQVGVVVVQSDRHSAMATAAKPSVGELYSHLIREAATTVHDLTSSTLAPIQTIDEKAAPIDHLRLYLEADQKWFLDNLISRTGQESEFPGFRLELRELTKKNGFANATGYHVYRATSAECQDLWFGPTENRFINLNRLKGILGRDIAYEELNHHPHPLA